METVRMMEQMEGIRGVRIRLQQGENEEEEEIWLIAISALHREQAILAIRYGMERLKNSI